MLNRAIPQCIFRENRKDSDGYVRAIDVQQAKNKISRVVDTYAKYAGSYELARIQVDGRGSWKVKIEGTLTRDKRFFSYPFKNQVSGEMVDVLEHEGFYVASISGLQQLRFTVEELSDRGSVCVWMALV